MPGKRGNGALLGHTDASVFFEKWLSEHDIDLDDHDVSRPGTVKELKQCQELADEAREAFKKSKPAAVSSNPLPLAAARGPSAVKKHSRRLMNNRKSAAAKCVFQKVLDASKSDKIASLARERDTAVAERDRLKALLVAERGTSLAANAENERLQNMIGRFELKAYPAGHEALAPTNIEPFYVEPSTDTVRGNCESSHSSRHPTDLYLLSSQEVEEPEMSEYESCRVNKNEVKTEHQDLSDPNFY